MTALRLRIISDHRRLLGDRSTITFGRDGGTIGRSADNDWILPDPQRYISAHHARVRFSDGEFFVEDTSTNGVFVNDDERPVRESGPYRLRSGDVLRLGEYQVVAALEPHAMAAGHAAAQPGAEDAGALSPALEAMPTHIEALQRLGRAAQTDLGAALNLDDLLVTDTPTGSRARPVNAYGQAVLAQQSHGSPHAASPSADPNDEEVGRRIERLARAAAKARDPRNASLPALYDVQSGLQAFCRGAGIDPERLPADAQTRLLHLVGQLLREALVGLKDLERSRQQIRNRFRIDLPVDPDDPRSSLVRAAIEELLIELLAQHESRRIDAVQWLREAVDTAKAHERATSEALRAAFVEFIGRFDPAELEARFQRALRRGAKGGKPPENGEARYWQLFVEFYRNLSEMAPDQLPHTFVEAFATAYKAALQSAKAPQQP